MSTCECSITNPKKQLEFYRDLSEQLQVENKQLKKQLEEYKDKVNWYENFNRNKTIDALRIRHNNQQKEFIEYLEYQIQLQEELNDKHLATGFEEILSKYKEIIGNDINVGSKG